MESVFSNNTCKIMKEKKREKERIGQKQELNTLCNSNKDLKLIKL